MSFDKKVAGLNERFTHNWEDETNHTHTVQDAGIYFIHYGVMVADSAPSPNAHVGIRMIHTNGTKVKGSYQEKDSSKQNAEYPINHGFLTTFGAGDTFVIQLTSDDTTVCATTHATFESAGSATKISMHKVANL